jgi:HAMP domain-containing protein
MNTSSLPPNGPAAHTGKSNFLRKSFFSSLRFLFLLIILLVLIPIFGLMLSFSSEQRKTSSAQYQQNAITTVKGAADDYGNLIYNARLILATLADLPSLKTGNYVGCSDVFSILPKKYSGFINFAAYDLSGNRICVSNPNLYQQNISAQDWFQKEIKQRAFISTNFQLGLLSDRAVMINLYPVYGASGQFQAVVTAWIDTSWLSQFINTTDLPAGYNVSIVDRSGAIIALFPATDNKPGTVIPERLLQPILKNNGEGSIEAAGLDGINRLYGFTTLNNSFGVQYLQVGLPIAAVYGPLDLMLSEYLIGMVVITALALLIAYLLFGLFFLNPMDALVDTTRRLAAGDLTSRIELDPGSSEIGQLGMAFDQMAQALENR